MNVSIENHLIDPIVVVAAENSLKTLPDVVSAQKTGIQAGTKFSVLLPSQHHV